MDLVLKILAGLVMLGHIRRLQHVVHSISSLCLSRRYRKVLPAQIRALAATDTYLARYFALLNIDQATENHLVAVTCGARVRDENNTPWQTCLMKPQMHILRRARGDMNPELEIKAFSMRLRCATFDDLTSSKMNVNWGERPSEKRRGVPAEPSFDRSARRYIETCTTPPKSLRTVEFPRLRGRKEQQQVPKSLHSLP